ncbi:MAG: hypothetical protein FJX56_06645 [Alphaproteobacteria bacterium]|nr:hypothetical protein [Alphaproteobacteria bacterium]
MFFRIGINLGDVIVDGADIYGEGVNVAARLQALAPPGGVCISGTVYDHVRNKLPVGFEYLGRQSVKNMADAIPAYRVKLGGESAETEKGEREAAAAAEPEGVAPARRRNGFSLPRVAGLIVLLFVVDVLTGGGLWFYWPALGLSIALLIRALKSGQRFRFGEHHGDLTISENTALFGTIVSGSLRIRGRTRVWLFGRVDGDVIAEEGAEAVIFGDVGGVVTENGGRVHHVGRAHGRRMAAADGEDDAA